MAKGGAACRRALRHLCRVRPFAEEVCLRPVKYFVAMSLDGYLAGPGGEVNWLFIDQDYGMSKFFASIDTLLIGRKTYEFMLSQGSRSFPGGVNYVFSKSLKQSDCPEVTIVSRDAEKVVAALREQSGKDIWLMGGGELFASLLAAGLVDEIGVAVHPILLGRGIPFLPPTDQATTLKLLRTTRYSTGLVSLHYAVQGSSPARAQ
jgi:dihydrofolate reductase